MFLLEMDVDLPIQALVWFRGHKATEPSDTSEVKSEKKNMGIKSVKTRSVKFYGHSGSPIHLFVNLSCKIPCMFLEEYVCDAKLF